MNTKNGHHKIGFDKIKSDSDQLKIVIHEPDPPAMLSWIKCTGKEAHFNECRKSHWEKHNCPVVAGVKCVFSNK